MYMYIQNVRMGSWEGRVWRVGIGYMVHPAEQDGLGDWVGVSV